MRRWLVWGWLFAVAACGSESGVLDSPSDGDGGPDGARDAAIAPPERDATSPDATAADDAAADVPRTEDAADDRAAFDATVVDGGVDATVDAAVDADGGTVGFAPECVLCHGDKATRNPAPPRSVSGRTATTAHQVGAHTAHLSSSNWRHAIVCEDCHLVPTSPDHLNSMLDFNWSALAGPVNYDVTTYACTGASCHGASLAQDGKGAAREPVWNVVDGTFNGCGTSCHAVPPGGRHPNDSGCPTCHGDVIASFDPVTKAATWKDPSRHVDGKVDLAGGLGCTSCHGDKATKDPSPPRGTKGELLTTDPAVGAHAKHLGASTWRRDIPCTDCHAVPAQVLHSDGKTDFRWGAVPTTGSATPHYDATLRSCTGVYCHGATLGPAATGGTVQREPVFNQVDGTFSACGASCHTNPPGGTHPVNDGCPTCHGAVIASYDPATKAATWTDRSLHVDGIVERVSLTCTSCHGNAVRGDPAPPSGTKGEVATTAQAVGAHQAHLATSGWRKDLACTDCHAVPTSTSHFDGKTDFAWSSLARGRGASPAYDSATARCSNVYCHGTNLMGPKATGIVARTPVWNQVDGTFNVCGSTCHTNPPGGTHPADDRCATCHGDVIASYDPSTGAATWKDRTLHVDGLVQRSALTCTTCHGDPSRNEAPPFGTRGEIVPSQRAVGAHQHHLATSPWHRDVLCTDCHTRPISTSHANGVTETAWSTVAAADGARPGYDTSTATCSGVYCHGATLLPAASGGTTRRAPVWTTVDGTYLECGASCHTNPPGGTHPVSTACPTCHGAVIASYDPATRAATWADKSLHVNGVVDRLDLTCTSCHGDKATGDPAPPRGTKGETLTTQGAVGAHQQHLTPASWRKDVVCTDCHAVPISTTHTNSKTDFSFSALATTGGTSPQYTSATCSGVYCHGVTLKGAAAGGTVKRSPVWTQVDGTYDACGASCHTNPPGGGHVAHTDCAICHSTVIATYNAATGAATWTNPALHVDGVAQSHAVHDLPGWTAPAFGQNHHGTRYFLQNQQRDEHGRACTSCHGADYAGGTVGVSCNNASCHRGTDWRGCSFCHGTSPSQVNPPRGVGGETTTATLAVGRHAAHVTAGTTHAAFACSNCHTVPAAGDVAHALGYVPSPSLESAGHHGDVSFSGGGAGMTFNVAATQGVPVAARGTCLGGCHSNGRGGAPAVTPYWAGGTWPTGSCTSCHPGTMSTLAARHPKHSGEGLACTACHPAATGASHMNGTKEVSATITGPGGGSVTTLSPGAPGNTCTAAWSCSGTCHGQSHRTFCWR